MVAVTRIFDFQNEIKVTRQSLLLEKVVIVDGQPGCGKTMLSPIISSLDRVELLNYAFEIEFICRLYQLGKVTEDAATALVRMFVDHKLYQTMMGREVNFRYSDLSSVFKDANPWRYFKRIFREGDMAVPEKIQKERPILNLTTHDLLSVSEPVISGIGSKVVLIEVVRHPLYMIKQQELNMIRLLDNPRDIQVNIEYHGKQLPYFSVGWEEVFLNCNALEKAIYSMDRLSQNSDKKRKLWKENSDLSIITIPFEKFVIEPWSFMEEIKKALGTATTGKTAKIMKRQNVPRRKLADSPALSIYKRCGWTPPSGQSEESEMKIRRQYVAKNASTEALAIIDKLSEQYVANYLQVS